MNQFFELTRPSLFLGRINTMDTVSNFAKDHAGQLTAVVGLITYGLARKKFTAGGVVAGIVVCMIHMIHPWPAFFWLLTIFVFVGVLVTKVHPVSPAFLYLAY